MHDLSEQRNKLGNGDVRNKIPKNPSRLVTSVPHMNLKCCHSVFSKLSGEEMGDVIRL